jgi:hypothetical protein
MTASTIDVPWFGESASEIASLCVQGGMSCQSDIGKIHRPRDSYSLLKSRIPFTTACATLRALTVVLGFPCAELRYFIGFT